jgi:hypothetical protein
VDLVHGSVDRGTGAGLRKLWDGSLHLWVGSNLSTSLQIQRWIGNVAKAAVADGGMTGTHGGKGTEWHFHRPKLTVR